jgi:CubicO group peptidase (beta-lactamase class C family)
MTGPTHSPSIRTIILLSIGKKMYITPLPHSAPEAQGVSSAALLEFIEAADTTIHEMHSFMLLRHGQVLAECWWKPYAPELPHMLFSLSKSFTSTAIGLAVAEGRLTLDDHVLSFFPKDAPAEVSENLAAMCVRHLLSMSCGHHTDSMGRMWKRYRKNWVKGFLSLPVEHAPGTFWVYNTGATYMLSAILQKATGMKLLDYLQPRLFEPLGIQGASWETSPQGINMGGFGLSVKTEDIARFGQLYLQKGVWNGQRILSEAWVEAASSRQQDNGNVPESDWSQGYGYQFWRCKHNNYRGDGAFGQYCIVMPELDAVVAITSAVSDMQPTLNLVWDRLLPALGPKALPEDPAAHAALLQKLSGLGLSLVQGQSVSPLAAKVSGKCFQFEPNPLKLTSITFDFSKPDCQVMIVDANGEHRAVSNSIGWQAGTGLWMNNQPAASAVSGVWTAEDTYVLTIRFIETPFYNTYQCQFVDHQVKITGSINVSFGPLQTPPLVAHVI